MSSLHHERRMVPRRKRPTSWKWENPFRREITCADFATLDGSNCPDPVVTGLHLVVDADGNRDLQLYCRLKGLDHAGSMIASCMYWCLNELEFSPRMCLPYCYDIC